MTQIAAHHGLFKDTNLHVDDTGGSGRPVVAAGYRVVTYDRRGFGRSDKPKSGYGHGTLTEDLHTLLVALDLNDVTLVGFSMGGGEVARYFSAFGTERLRSVVFASAVPPYLMTTDDNPDGPLGKEMAAPMTAGLTQGPGIVDLPVIEAAAGFDWGVG